MSPEVHAGASVALFLAHAVTLEEEAAERYDELADTMAVHHNDVEALFRRMAGYSRLHRDEALGRAQAEGDVLPTLRPWEFAWPSPESPESAALADTHYLMDAHQALSLALTAERQAQAFYQQVADTSHDARVRELAGEFAEEEAEHARLLEEWLTRHPPSAAAALDDLDPPVAVD
ncbi:MAG: ferritin family protein [Gammaproteobacteria bacterium]|nr:ferritin family protein [Gammaproteobacteria bacterium]TVQ43985.1 MAG: rubrerythrin [Gammaproteobacteria bacterium]